MVQQGSNLSWYGLEVKSAVRKYVSYSPFVEFTRNKPVLRLQTVFVDIVLLTTKFLIIEF